MARRGLENADNTDMPDPKRQKMSCSDAKVKNGFSFNGSDYSHITCTVCVLNNVPVKPIDNENELLEDFDIKMEPKDTVVTVDTSDKSVKYIEYPCTALYLAMHSKQFENLIFKNGQMYSCTTVNTHTKVEVNDISCDTFEFIRDWCYPSKEPILNTTNVLPILIASHSYKYDVSSLHSHCIDYIRDQWIVDYKSLLNFIEQVSKFDKKCNSDSTERSNEYNAHNQSLVDCLSVIFTDNKILQRESAAIAKCEQVGLSMTVLKCLLDCNSLYVRGDLHLIWQLCINFINSEMNSCYYKCKICKSCFLRNINTNEENINACTTDICDNCKDTMRMGSSSECESSKSKSNSNSASNACTQLTALRNNDYNGLFSIAGDVVIVKNNFAKGVSSRVQTKHWNYDKNSVMHSPLFVVTIEHVGGVLIKFKLTNVYNENNGFGLDVAYCDEWWMSDEDC